MNPIITYPTVELGVDAYGYFLEEGGHVIGGGTGFPTEAEAIQAAADHEAHYVAERERAASMARHPSAQPALTWAQRVELNNLDKRPGGRRGR